ncbi:MAG: hypothetical protein AAF696_01775 [Bacteroidota bacterium]
MGKKTELQASVKKSLFTRIKALKKRSTFALAALVMVASGGYYESQVFKPLGLNYYEENEGAYLDHIASKEKYGLVLFTTDFCYPCENLNEELMYNVRMVELVNQSFIPYKVSSFSELDEDILRTKYRVRKFPSLLVLDSSGRAIEQISEWDSTSELLQSLSKYKQGEEEVYQARENRKNSAHTTTTFTLSLEKYDSYEEARKAALEKSSMWKKEVWIENTGKKFDIRLGAFDNNQDALLARNYLRTWEGLGSEVEVLNILPQVYP